ncbi:S8 family peptidase [Streptomyces sp. NBC_00887]|uniref:S8 family peptidase n=1 Tax=Streptomyces sp. NBC_00887 TaxID=2975859 RepID=UPI0038630039|nr:S8 family serine peptidase [Streptomyces sp. NBC_00887]WSY36209.1 S8 family serine peptidase [Streptomyces sp. NBC_00887]
MVGISMLLVALTPSVSLALADPPGSVLVPTPTSAFGPSSAVKGTPTETAQRWIPLITGDRIGVNAKGEIRSVRPAKGREHIPIRTETIGKHTYAMPDDARSLVRSGWLDRRLFDITTLSTPAYAQRPGLGLIVMYDETRPKSRKAIRSITGAEVEHTLASVNADAVTAPANGSTQLWSTLTDGPATATSRTATPGVASVWLDGVVQATLDQSVPQIGAPEAWAAGFDGTGTRIAILDSGVDATHPDLAGQVIAERNFSTSLNTQDLYGHGTHVASIAAGTGAKSEGTYKGVAPGARILNGKVLNDEGTGSLSGVIVGMEWAAAQKADVANVSLGTYDTPGIDPVEAAVNKLSAESGTLFVIAAGNNGQEGSGTVGTPGSAEAALTVGAVDKQDRLAPFSSTGPRIGDSGIKPDLTAPGVAIAAAAAKGSLLADRGDQVAEGYVGLSGTSMATPHVAGAAALLAQQHPDWTGDDIKKALLTSTTPGAYTPFEQGSGRVDLRKAIKQTVTTREASLSFGIALWPHTDDQPVSKNLTYRNMGSAAITLKLTMDATGPDGSPVPNGMFTFDDQVTIAPHGEATVKVTADTRLGGDTVGAFTGRITAEGDGQTVGTALAVDREAERFTLTVKPLDRKGKPAAAPSWDAYMVGMAGPAAGASVLLFGDTYSVRVPRGQYFLNSMLRVDPAGSTAQGIDWINQPMLEITKDTTVTLDARTAREIDVTVPGRTVSQIFGHISAHADPVDGVGSGFGVFVASFKEFHSAHLGPKVNPDLRLSQQLSLSFSTGAKGHDEYHLVYEPKGDKLLTGFTHHVRDRELSKVRVSLGAPARGKIGFVTPVTENGAGLGTERPLPDTTTLHLLSENPSWLLLFDQVDTHNNFESNYTSPVRTFTPGRSYRHEFNMGVFGPDLPEGAGFVRADEALLGTLPILSDGSGNESNNNSAYESAQTTLYGNGEMLRTSIYPMDFFYIAANERTDYRLTASIARGAVTDVSTNVTASWTFSSEYAPGITVLPVSVVRFTPKLSLDNTAKARAKMAVPVTVKGSAAGRNLKSLRVQVSYDHGAHWHEQPVRNGRVQITNPEAGGSVSFKAQAVDKQGNAVNETIYDAYLTK